jgi:hypothetical protein
MPTTTARWSIDMIEALIRWSVGNRFLVLLATFFRRLGALGDQVHAGRCLTRSFRRAGHHPHQLSGSGAADCREPGHLSAGDHHAFGARREDGARLFLLRRFLRLCAVRGWHRPLLGAFARARIPQPGAGEIARRRGIRRSVRMPRASAGFMSTR